MTEKNVFKVSYDVRSPATRGFIVTRTRKFTSLARAREFVQSIRETGYEVVGKPVIE